MAAYRCFLTLWILLQRMRRCVPLLLVALFLSVSTPSCAPAPEFRGGSLCDTTGDRKGFPSCLPQSSAVFCEHGAPKVVGHSKAFVGQGLFPSKYTIGPQRPQCPPSPDELFRRLDNQSVKDGAKQIGEQFGAATFACNSALESLDQATDHHAAAYQKANLKAVKVVLDNCQHDFEVIPQIPAFEGVELREIAKSAFEQGFQSGINEAFKRIVLIELAITAIEIAFIEAAPIVYAAGVELTAARGVRRALDVLREMPIFLPLTTDGAGVVMKVARGSSRALRQNLKSVKRMPLPGEFTHHIAAHGDSRAKLTVEILERFGIHVDDEVNGVFLPGFKTSPNPLGKVVHGNLHTDAYYKAVYKRLQNLGSRADVERALRKIAYELEHGIIPK